MMSHGVHHSHHPSKRQPGARRPALARKSQGSRKETGGQCVTLASPLNQIPRCVRSGHPLATRKDLVSSPRLLTRARGTLHIVGGTLSWEVGDHGTRPVLCPITRSPWPSLFSPSPPLLPTPQCSVENRFQRVWLKNPQPPANIAALPGSLVVNSSDPV